MRLAVRIVLIVAIVAGVGTWWVARTEPDWYTHIRYPLRYDAIIRAHILYHTDMSVLFVTN